MMAVEQSRKRKDKAHEDEVTVRSSAKAEGLSEAEIEARVRAIRHAADADCAAYMSTVDATKRDKHAKLVARLAKIKAKEAAEIQEINQDANGGGASTDDLEDRVREPLHQELLQAPVVVAGATEVQDAATRGELKSVLDQRQAVAG